MDREDERKNFLYRITNSVGYVESTDKKEFLKGAGITFDWLMKDFDIVKDQKATRIKDLEDSKEYYHTELKTLCEIIQRHSPEE